MQEFDISENILLSRRATKNFTRRLMSYDQLPPKKVSLIEYNGWKQEEVDGQVLSKDNEICLSAPLKFEGNLRGAEKQNKNENLPC